MAAIDYDDDKSPFTSAGDLEDESNLNEILMEEFDDDEKDIEDGVIDDTAALVEDEPTVEAEIDDDEIDEDDEAIEEEYN